MQKQDNLTTIFIQNVVALAKSIIIKSEYTAIKLNQLITDYYKNIIVDENNKNTWKYYLNLAGEYHDIDKIMYVSSLDTLELIIFNKSNLQLHTATRDAYQFGSDYYKSLVNKYPEQEILIKGILYPVDIDVAIKAKDRTILGYPPFLIEENEIYLIPYLQNFLYNYKLKWTNETFNIVDSLYIAYEHGIMYALLIPAILTSRLNECKTNAVHSYHLNNYLASHGFLNNYLTNLTVKQKLLFYRNIKYIQRNCGKQEIFDWFIENVITASGIPLSEFNIKQDFNLQHINILPELTYDKEKLNKWYDPTVNKKFNTEQIFNKENPLGLINQTVKQEAINKAIKNMQFSSASFYKTKLLESSMIDESDSDIYRFYNIIINHWLYLSTNNKYTAYSGYNNPRTNKYISMSVKDCLILAIYCYYKSLDLTTNITYIPPLIADRVVKLVKPTFQQIRNVTIKKYLKDSSIQTLLTEQPNISSYISISSFHDLCLSIYNNSVKQNKYLWYEEDFNKTGQLAGAIEYMYNNVMCHLETPDLTYDTFFNRTNIELEFDLSRSEYEQIYVQLINNSTGLSKEKSNKSVEVLQKVMLELTSKFSSYAIQFARDINSESIKYCNWQYVKRSNISGNTKSREFYNIGYIECLNIKEKCIDTRIYDGIKIHIKDTLSRVTSGNNFLDLNIYIKQLSKNETTYFYNYPVVSVFSEYDTNTDDISPLPGINIFNSLTESQKQLLLGLTND